MDTNRRNTILFFSPFAICFLLIVLFKWIFHIGTKDWVYDFLEIIWLIILTVIIGTMTLLLSRIKTFKTTKRLVLIQIGLCFLGLIIQIFFGGIYKEIAPAERQPTCSEIIQEIQNKYISQKDMKIIDFEIDLLNLVTTSVTTCEKSEEFSKELTKFMNIHLVYPDELKKMPMKEFMEFLFKYDENGYKLIKIGPQLFELRKKSELKPK